MKSINELMATEVMGWEITSDKTPEGISYTTGYDIDGKGTYYKTGFTPTTDMNQAMECVVEYYRDRDDDFELHYTGSGNWMVIMEEFENYWVISDKSAPLAICKAILKAKGISFDR